MAAREKGSSHGPRHYLVTTEQERHLLTEKLGSSNPQGQRGGGSAKLDQPSMLPQNRLKPAECSAIVNRIDPHLNTGSVSVLPT